jgi:hypothetical protein
MPKNVTVFGHSRRGSYLPADEHTGAKAAA